MAASAKAQASVALGLAAVLWIGWAAAGLPLRVRWMVARGAPPASAAMAESTAAEIRTLGVPARAALLDLFRGSGSRARKSWVASLLLRAPFFAEAEIEKGLGAADAVTARAAAFALLGGEEEAPADAGGVAVVTPSEGQATPREPRFAWDPAPAVPVLVSWMADPADLEAHVAARLLGRIPPGDLRVTEALLKVVEEVPGILAPDASPDRRLRRAVVIAALQGLVPRAKEDPEIVARTGKVVAWIQENGHTDGAWDIESAALRLAEMSRGRGVPPGLFARLAEDPNPPVRQRLASTLEAVPGAEATRLLEMLTRAAEPVVRRAAVLAILKRRDPVLFRIAPRLVEDSHIYIASDALRGLGEMWRIEPERCRAVVPLLVSRLEDPWPGEGPAPETPAAGQHLGGKVDVIEAAVLSLYKITHLAPGFGDGANDLLDWKKKATICRGLAEDPSKRRAVVDEWRKTVPANPSGRRIPPLVEMLEARDEDNVVRGMRELARLTEGDGVSPSPTGFPAAVMSRAGDDIAARNSVREWRKTPEFGKTVEAWKARAARE